MHVTQIPTPKHTNTIIQTDNVEEKTKEQAVCESWFSFWQERVRVVIARNVYINNEEMPFTWFIKKTRY